MQTQRERIEDLLIEEELKDSYLSFAVSVIVSRALPDVRDGLKPSQRRILVAMNDLNLGPRSKYRKCAKIAGDTSGNYHPHGEQVVYPTLYRMAQDFNMRYTLVDGQGNFGSIDGDAPAAMRYTEARMTSIAVDMLDEIPYDTVDFTPNYDETRTEPTVLPAKFPNLLCNGSSGIAVGMATNIPPHNLTEVSDALILLLDNPDAGIGEILKVIPGPDFATGGIICGREGIRTAYKTGRGSATVRARVSTEEARGGKTNIVVTEIPPQVNKVKIIDTIADAVRAERIKGISDINDESDREGMRLVIQLKKGEDPNVVLNQLYKHSPLQTSVSIILLAIDKGRPRTLSLKDMLQLFLDHRIEVVQRRTAHLLAKAEDRAHILEGLKIALQNIDAVIKTIKTSKTVDEARSGLMKNFKLTEHQANAILEMRLQRLTGLEQEKINEEYRGLIEKIAYYKGILENEGLLRGIIRDELLDIKKRYGDARRSEIVDQAATDFDTQDLIAEESVAVTITRDGYVKRLPLSIYRKQGRGGKGVIGTELKEGDFVENFFVASTHDYILFFTSRGKVYWQKVYDIPQMSRTARGRALVNMLNLSNRELITSMIPVRQFDDHNLLMVTRNGIIKKTHLSAFSRPKRGGIAAIGLGENDTLVDVKLTAGTDSILLGTSKGQAIRFSEEAVRSMGRTARGVKGISLGAGDSICGAVLVDDSASLLTVCANGYGKRTSFNEYRPQGRGGKGLINIKTSKRNGDVVALIDVRETEDVILMTSSGKVVRIPVGSISVIGRSTQGVRLIRIDGLNTVVALARAPSEIDVPPEENQLPEENQAEETA